MMHMHVNSLIIDCSRTTADDQDVWFPAVKLRGTFCPLQTVLQLRRLSTYVILFSTHH